MSEKITELKPCPFCDGNRAGKRVVSDEPWTHCWSCGADGPQADPDGDKWNTRPAEDRLKAERNQAIECLEDFLVHLSMGWELDGILKEAAVLVEGYRAQTGMPDLAQDIVAATGEGK